MGKQIYTPGTLLEKGLHMCKVSGIRFLTGHTYVMRFERNNILFKAGQCVTFGLQDSLHTGNIRFTGEKMKTTWK